MSRRGEPPDVPRDGARTGRKPGQSAREKQQELAQAAPIRTFFTRLFGIHTDERAWRRGADGEEHVGALLEALRPQGWAVEHDVKIGRNGANVDHLVIGPPGVFVINTKMVGGEVWVSGDTVKVDNHRRDYVEKLEAEAKRVREKLLGATRRHSLWVQGLLVFVRPSMVVKRQPQHVAVLADHELVPGLLAQEVRLEPREVEELVRASRRDATWA